MRRKRERKVRKVDERLYLDEKIELEKEYDELRRASRPSATKYMHLHYKPYKRAKYILDITKGNLEETVNNIANWITIPQINLEKVLDYIHNEIGKIDVPGYSWAIVKNGLLVEAGGNGWARGPSDSNPRIMDENTKMVSGSMAKSICAVAIMQLVEKNKINLNDKFYPLVDKFYNANASAKVKQLTIRNLLEHSTGFVHKAISDMSNLDWLNNYIVEQLESSPDSPNGSSYANANYILLARVVESVSNKNYIDYVQDNIVKVLNNYAPTTILTNKEENNPCLYYESDEYSSSGNIGDIPSDWQGATGWYASAIDWAKFLAVFRYNKLVSKETKEQMIEYRQNYEKGSFGFWKFGDNKPFGTYYHGGAQNSKNCKGGFYGKMISFPNNIDIVLLTNRKMWKAEEGKRLSIILREAYLAGFGITNDGTIITI